MLEIKLLVTKNKKKLSVGDAWSNCKIDRIWTLLDNNPRSWIYLQLDNNTEVWINKNEIEYFIIGLPENKKGD